MVINILVSNESENGGAADEAASEAQASDITPERGVRWRSLFGGIALAVAALLLLVSNEQRALDRESALASHLASAIPAPADELDESLEGALVHLEAPLVAPAPLRDNRIPVEVRALRLDRRVQMYQWEAQKATREETSPSGESRRVEVESYAKIWSEKPIDSSAFADTIHANPAFPFSSRRFEVSSPRLGQLRVPVEVIKNLNDFNPLPPDPVVAEAATLGRPVTARGDHYYVGTDPEAPEIGDLRVIYRIIPEGVVASGIGQQVGDTLAAFSFRDETLPSVVLPGSHGPHALMASTPDPIARWVNLIRALAIVLLIGASFFALGALSGLKARDDWAGDLFRGGLAASATILGLGLGLCVVGIVWIAAEHFAGIAFIVLGLAILVFGGRYRLSAGAKARLKGSGGGAAMADKKGGIDP